MVNIRRRLFQFLFYIAAIELMVLLFFAFTTFARAGYHPRQAWQSTLAAAGLTHPARLPPGAKFDRVSLEMALIFSVFLGLAAAMVVGFIIYAGRALRSLPQPVGSGGAGLEGRLRPTFQRRVTSGDDMAGAPDEIPLTVTTRTVSWSGIVSAMMVVCLVCGFGSLVTLPLSYFHHPIGTEYYWVGWVVALSLAVGFGTRFPPGVDPTRLRSRSYIKAYLKAAPVWLRIIVIAAGLLLAAMCLRTGYIMLNRPGDFTANMRSENFAAALAFLFFVDALAFTPFPRSDKR
jgi:hypothetical protein